MHTCTCTCPQTHVRHMSGTDTCQAHAHAHVHVHAMHMSGRQAGRQAGRQTVATLTRPRAPFGRLSSPRAPLVLTGGWRGRHATSSTRRDATSSAPFRDFSETVPRPVRDRAETFPVRRIVQATQSGRWRRCSAGWRPAIWCCCCYSSSTSSTTPDATPDTTPEEAACGGGRAAAGVRRQHARLHARMCAVRGRRGGAEARPMCEPGALRVGLVETRERRPSVVPPPVECRAVVGRAAADVVRLGRLQTRICSSPVFPVSTLQTRHLRRGRRVGLRAQSCSSCVCGARFAALYNLERRGRAVPSTCQHGGVCCTLPSLPLPPATATAGATPTALARALSPTPSVPARPRDTHDRGQIGAPRAAEASARTARP